MAKKSKPQKSKIPKSKASDNSSPKTNLLFLQFKAFVIDLFMIYTPILYIMTYFILGSAEAFRTNQGAIFICVLLYGLIASLFLSIAGQTPGMKAQGLMLLNQQGKKPNILLALLRFTLWLFGCAFLFGFIFPFMRKDRLSFQDWLCKTKIQQTFIGLK